MRPQAAEDYYGRFLNNTNEGSTPSYVRFWMFNITNLDEVHKGAKPNVTEMGPYTYRAYFENFGVEFDYAGMMSYRGYTKYIFQPDLSPGVAENDTVVTLNLPFLGALIELKARYKHFHWLMDRISYLIERWGQGKAMGLFMSRRVEELLWGYLDPLLYRLQDYVDVNPEFSLMHNGSVDVALSDELTVINTGAANLTALCNIEQLRGVSNVSSWNNHTEMVRGTDGAHFHPWMADNETMTVWVNELFRAVELSPIGSVEKDGVRLLRYELDPSMANADPRFYQYVEGLFNATSPTVAGPNGPSDQHGLPVYFSLPHYCHAASNLAEGVNGLKCNLTRHELYIDVEPVTGQTWRAAKRLMMSSEFGPDFKSVDAHLNRTILPIFWIEESGEASAAQAEVLNDRVFKIQRLIQMSGQLPIMLAILLGTILLFITIAPFVARKKRWRPKMMWGGQAFAQNGAHT
eukprot:evm.model.scf_1109.2 EVM.evm.TU.scf_1109.2   scf_1109:16382-23924(+)